MYYVEINNSNNAIQVFYSDRDAKPDPVYAGTTVYFVSALPEGFTHYIEGMTFDPETGKLSHSAKSRNSVYRDYLRLTDWYVIRFMEIGTPIPDFIQQGRQQARQGILETGPGS